MSQDRDLNPGPFPYHGNALPTELSWRFVGGEGLEPPKSRGLVVYSHMQLPLCEPPSNITYSNTKSLFFPPSSRFNGTSADKQ